MISDSELIIFNKEGFIAGPKEDAKTFLERVSLTKCFINNPKDFFIDNKKFYVSLRNKIKKPIWSWTKTHLKHLYDFSPEYFFAFYQNKNLTSFEGAATWQLSKGNKNLNIPILQVRENFKKRGEYLRIYQLDEILAHESVHALRIAYNEPQFEEIFAYLTSNSFLRRIFGALIRSSYEGIVFFALLMCGLMFQVVSFYYDSLTLLFLLFSMLSIAWASIGLFRLFKAKWMLRKAYKKVFPLFYDRNKTFSVLVRLTDAEIKKISKEKSKNVLKYFYDNKDKSIRIRQIYYSYFEKRQSM